MWTPLLILALGRLASGAAAVGDGSAAHLESCQDKARPLVTETKMVVPSTPEELANVCYNWRLFVNCIDEFVMSGYSSDQRSAFKGAVQTAVDSVHKMCADPVYSKEYLVHAPCIQKMMMDESRCGADYSAMARAVIGGAPDADVCCRYLQYRSCMAADPGCPDSDSRLTMYVNTYLDNGLQLFVHKCHSSLFTLESCESGGGDSGGGWQSIRGDDSYNQQRTVSARYQLEPERYDADREQQDKGARSEYSHERAYLNREGSSYNKYNSDDEQERSGYNQERSDYTRERSDYNQDRSDYARERSDYNRDRSDYNRDRSDYNKERSDNRDRSDYKERSDYARERSDNWDRSSYKQEGSDNNQNSSELNVEPITEYYQARSDDGGGWQSIREYNSGKQRHTDSSRTNIERSRYDHDDKLPRTEDDSAYDRARSDNNRERSNYSRDNSEYYRERTDYNSERSDYASERQQYARDSDGYIIRPVVRASLDEVAEHEVPPVDVPRYARGGPEMDQSAAASESSSVAVPANWRRENGQILVIQDRREDSDRARAVDRALEKAVERGVERSDVEGPGVVSNQWQQQPMQVSASERSELPERRLGDSTRPIIIPDHLKDTAPLAPGARAAELRGQPAVSVSSPDGWSRLRPVGSQQGRDWPRTGPAPLDRIDRPARREHEWQRGYPEREPEREPERTPERPLDLPAAPESDGRGQWQSIRGDTFGRDQPQTFGADRPFAGQDAAVPSRGPAAESSIAPATGDLSVDEARARDRAARIGGDDSARSRARASDAPQPTPAGYLPSPTAGSGFTSLRPSSRPEPSADPSPSDSYPFHTSPGVANSGDKSPRFSDTGFSDDSQGRSHSTDFDDGFVPIINSAAKEYPGAEFSHVDPTPDRSAETFRESRRDDFRNSASDFDRDNAQNSDRDSFRDSSRDPDPSDNPFLDAPQDASRDSFRGLTDDQARDTFRDTPVEDKSRDSFRDPVPSQSSDSFRDPSPSQASDAFNDLAPVPSNDPFSDERAADQARHAFHDRDDVTTPQPLGTTTAYKGWFQPQTPTRTWVISNSLEDRARAERQRYYNATPDTAPPSLLSLMAALVVACLFSWGR